jgi:hypothetical protein
MGRWYYYLDDGTKGDEPRGPVSLEVLVELIRTGQLSDASLVRREEGEHWAAADEHREVLELLPLDLGGLVASYLAAAALPEWPDEDWWVWEKVQRMIDAHPEVAWQIILRLVASAPSDSVLAVVAAGPLEGLICRHPREMIDRVEQRVRQDARFREAVSGVWGRSRLPSDVRARLDAIVRPVS